MGWLTYCQGLPIIDNWRIYPHTDTGCDFCTPLPAGEGWGESFQKSANRDRSQYINIPTENGWCYDYEYQFISPVGRAG